MNAEFKNNYNALQKFLLDGFMSFTLVFFDLVYDPVLNLVKMCCSKLTTRNWE